jgi:hypothetical protein
VNIASVPCDIPALPLGWKLNIGNKAVASKVENHTAKFVRESLFGKRRNRNHTEAASRVPPTALNNKRCEIAIATPWKSRGPIMASPFPLQELAQTLEFIRVDALVLKNIQDKQFVGVFEKSTNQVLDFKPRSILLAHQRRINMSAPLFHVLHISLFFQDSYRGEHGVICQGKIGRQSVHNLVDGDGAFLPKDLHEAKLSFG